MITMLFVGVATLVVSAYLRPQWFFTLLSLVAFGLFFDVINGHWMQYFLFVLGVILLIIELYIPGFGIAGIAGLCTTVAALYWHTMDALMVLLLVSFSLLTIVLTAWIFSKLNIPIKLGPNFVLETALNKPSGFSATPDLTFLNGQSGITVTALRPIGRARFGEEIYDVISDLDMIQSDCTIVVHRVEGSKIYVRKETI